MSYGGQYPFWLNNQACHAESSAMQARSETTNERNKKEDYKKRLGNVEKVVIELKKLLDDLQKEGKIDLESFKMIDEQIMKIK